MLPEHVGWWEDVPFPGARQASVKLSSYNVVNGAKFE